MTYSSKIPDLSLTKENKIQDHDSSIEYLAESYGDDIFQRLLSSLFSKDFSQQEAIDFWRSAMSNFNKDNSRMNWRSVILDYLLTRTDMLTNPRIIEAEELKRLQNDAITDGLTNLYNQTHFKQRLATIIQEHDSQPDSVFSLIILDLDRFKQFNDRCGHLRGDNALEKIGRLICSQLPKDGLAARYGGEEFAVILPGTDLPGAIEISEQIRAKVADTEFDGEDRLDTGKLTISGGIASYPTAGTTSDTLISRADSKLYEAKISRNCVAPKPTDTRNVTRHNYRSIVEIFNPSSGNFKNALSADISNTGILLKSSTPAVIGSNLDLHFPYPFWPSEHQTRGQVKHVRKNGHRGEFLVGVEFLQPQIKFLEGILTA